MDGNTKVIPKLTLKCFFRMVKGHGLRKPLLPSVAILPFRIRSGLTRVMSSRLGKKL
jgi:hypothetical protein